MKFTSQKRLAAKLAKASPKRIKFNKENLEEIKEAITKKDIKTLIKEKSIRVLQKTGNSRVRARKRAVQKTKGRQKGLGKRKGKATARTPKKDTWMKKVRAQRELIKKMRDNELITKEVYHKIYNRVKGGFFRSRRHIKLYLEERKLIKKKD